MSRQIRSLLKRIRSIFLYDYYYPRVRATKVKGWISYNLKTAEHIFTQLQQQGIPTDNFTIDSSDYYSYFNQAGYSEYYPNYYSYNIYEKAMEHYIAQKLLHLTETDVYIDIGSENSPVPEIYNRLYGCDTYAQDLSYDSGLNGKFIGGDAAAMPVNDGFATKMALHCSFEHFEGDSDIGFIHECKRVLRKGGAVCIVPLYLFDRYAIQTDPTLSIPATVSFENDAVIYCAKKWLNRYGRFYDPYHFQARIVHNLRGMQMTLYRVTNAKEVHQLCGVRFALLITNR